MSAEAALGRNTARMRGLAINSIRRGQGLYPRDNAVLERVLGNKGRAVMTVPELDAVLAWLEHDRLGDHLHLLVDDAGYAREALIDPLGRVTLLGRRRKKAMPRYSFEPPQPDYPAASLAHFASAALSGKSSSGAPSTPLTRTEEPDLSF
jgi:hypothetical protein